MAKKIFKVSRTSDEEYEVVDMEESEEETIDMEEEETTDEETMDMAGMEDMCKDMGYESIGDALEDLKQRKESETSDEEEEETSDEETEETEDQESEEEETNDEESEEETSTGDAAPNLGNIEKALATIKSGKAKDEAIKALSKVKDAIKGHVKVADQVSAGLLKAKPVEDSETEEVETISYGAYVKDAQKNK